MFQRARWSSSIIPGRQRVVKVFVWLGTRHPKPEPERGRAACENNLIAAL